MSDEPNVHGLRRSDFTSSARRQLRQECGFGCVVCGSALYEIAHVDPPFEEARVHDISRMALLCVKHHKELDRWHRISKEDVLRARASPRAIQDRSSVDRFVCTATEFGLSIGTAMFFNCHQILSIEGSDVLRIDPPENAGEPHEISGLFCDGDGQLVATAVRNEFRYRSETWEIDVEGPKVTFRSGPGRISLSLKALGSNGMRIERMDMMWCGVHVFADEDELRVSGAASAQLSLAGSPLFQDVASCIRVENSTVYLGGMPITGAVRMFSGLILGDRG